MVCFDLRKPHIRIFDSSDLPAQDRDFPSEYAAMVRSKRFAEIAGLMDGTPSDQPTLKRFSRYNHSLYSSRPSSLSILEPASSQTCSKNGKLKTGIFSGHWTLRDKKESRPSIQNLKKKSKETAESTPASPGEIRTSGGKDSIYRRQSNPAIIPHPVVLNYRNSFSSGSVPKQMAIRTSANEQCSLDVSMSYGSCSDKNEERIIPIEIQTIHNIAICRDKMDLAGFQKPKKTRNIPINIENQSRSHNIVNFNSGFRSTYDQLPRSAEFHLKRPSLDENSNDYGKIANNKECDEENVKELNLLDDGEDKKVSLMKRIGCIKSIGPNKRGWHRPILEVFPATPNIPEPVIEDCTQPVPLPESRRDSTPSVDGYHSFNLCTMNDCFATNLVIDADSAYKTGTSDSSPSSMGSAIGRGRSILRKSCPDLRDSTDITVAKNLEAHRVNPRTRRAREKRQAALWMKKPIVRWNLDDILLWLQYCRLDEVASIMIGYELSGKDVEQWDEETLEQLGVVNKDARCAVLRELNNLKEREKIVEENEEKDENHAKRSRNRIPLFKLVRSTSYDKVVAVETPLTTRDITVAEGRFGCLQVTKVNGAKIPLKEQDCFLEINEKPGQLFRSPLMFTKLVSEAGGTPIRLVVLRRRSISEEEEDDEFININGCNYLQRTLNAIEQESSGSSGVSSSELCSEIQLPIADDNISQVLRL